MKNIKMITIAFSFLATTAHAASIQWCTADHNGKVFKCHSSKAACERYIKGRFNWQCVTIQK